MSHQVFNVCVLHFFGMNRHKAAGAGAQWIIDHQLLAADDIHRKLFCLLPLLGS